MELFFKPSAKNDLHEIWLYLTEESKSPTLADRHIEALLVAIQSLKHSPNLGKLLGKSFPEYRKMVHGNYLIFYKHLDTKIEIIRLVHAAREWKNIL